AISPRSFLLRSLCCILAGKLVDGSIPNASFLPTRRTTPRRSSEYLVAPFAQQHPGTDWRSVVRRGSNPFLRRNPVLRGLLEEQADEIIARMSAVDSVAFEVHRVLAKRTAGGDLRIGSVAKELSTATRTLQRRLDAAGLSYQDLVDLTRGETAEKYLAKLSLSIAEVSYVLGYSEPSAFHRAFRR